MPTGKRKRYKETVASVDAELDPRKLRWSCDSALFDFTTTADIGECPIRIIGQPRASEALRLGFSVRSDGYNIFACGEVGSGRSTCVKRELAAVKHEGHAPDDLAYVHNFNDPDQPKLLRFPAGMGKQFAGAMDETIYTLRKTLAELFESDLYRRKLSSRIEEAKATHKKLTKGFEKEVERKGFAMVQMQVGDTTRLDVAPVTDGNPVSMDELESLVEAGNLDRADFDKIETLRSHLVEKLQNIHKKLHAQDRKLRKDLENLGRDLAWPLVHESLNDLAELFDQEDIRMFLEEVQDEVLSSLEAFKLPEDEEGTAREGGLADDTMALSKYSVNVLVNHAGTSKRPVIWETAPTYRNLFGTIEKTKDESGEWQTDHSRIKAGSILRANGGFLVIDALDMLAENRVWPALKRTLRTRKLEIQSIDPMLMAAGAALKPEPAEIDVTVVMIGTPYIYNLLYHMDEDFKKIFKVKAEFATDTPLSNEELQNYACFVHKKCGDDNLPPFHRDAVAAVVEEGVRLAGRQDKLTTRFNEIADVIRESGYWARQKKAKNVRARHVEIAVRKRLRRHDLLEELLRTRIAEGTVLLNLDGEAVGQLNGLVYLDVGDHNFGQPARITAVTAVGGAGIIDIERESEKSGAIHTKGVLILSGFLRSRFAQCRPLALSASLCFEQNYGPIDGDSASSAELYALLSSLAGVPLQQGVAVTGSVNQKGEIQPIGGVNEKIEGFYDICRITGFTGNQGVMIPTANIPHLMLRQDVVTAVSRKRFRIWAVSSVDQGIEVLTGVEAGERSPGGEYPEGSIYHGVNQRLEELAELAGKYGVTAKRADA